MTRNDLETLAATRQPNCITVYIPVYAAGMDAQTNPIRLKTALQEAKQALSERGMEARSIASLLEPAWDFQDTDEPEWRHWDGGLALFLSPGIFQVHNMPAPFEERVRVADRFYLKPLLPVLVSDGLFYVLAVSRKDVRLLSCTRDTVARVEVDSLPSSIVDALGPETTSERLQSQASARGRQRDSPVFHGHGGGADDRDEDLTRYLRAISKAVQEVLGGHREPLVLAGVEYLHSAYAKVNAYEHLTGEGVRGSPEHLRDEELRDRAWGIVEPAFTQGLRKAQVTWDRYAGSDKTSDLLEAIVPAAHDRRVDTLFVALGEHRWGQYDAEARQVMVHEEPQPEDDELLDLCAVNTLLSDGSVYAVPSEEVPGDGPAAAILRY